MNLAVKAGLFSQKAHKGQKYGDDDYFTAHILHVVSKCIDYGWTDDETIAVAYLHDVLEDTENTYSDLRKVFPVSVCYAVGELTKKTGQSLEEYLNEISYVPVAMRVKIADCSVNLKNSMNKENIHRVKKYAYCLDYLMSRYKP